MSVEGKEEKGVSVEWIEGDMDEYKMSRWMDGRKNEWMHEKNTWMNVEEIMWKRIFNYCRNLLG